MRIGFLLASLLILSHSGLARQASDDAPKWDVSATHGPTTEVAFTTSEGTWMNLDVSPDGKTIVFDLLGDLYTLPISGGKATRLTSGPAFDLQPRYSPDGGRIAFTSDRAGGDNLWTMAKDGTDQVQVTKESFRLLNGPAWTADGEYLLGRKHFTSTRSLGAGELWMYHASGEGSAGLQLTERKNDQQDQANEIAASPDGKYVYFSEDMSGGSSFEYNKDPNGQIYVIRRLDLKTGDLRNVITGQGGSARPVPSPNGKQIAFVRRVRAETVLFLADLESGAQRPLFDGLSHDQQEAWAIFGVYPHFAWTPDGKSLVFWAQGGLHRLDVATRAVTPIPFAADVALTVSETVRSPQAVFTPNFESKMIRQTATSPDGKRLVFHAAGYLWTKTLPDGRPARLTSGSAFEYDPAFSPDGKTIVFTTWSDEAFGGISSVAASGGTPKRLTSRPGYYLTPRYAADASRIVYERGRGNSLLGGLHGLEPGIYWMAAGGGEEHRILDHGSDPRFGPAGDRVLFMTGGGLSKEFRSARLDGGDERTHVTMKYPSNIVPSPDGQWLAFTELFNVYVTPFPSTGRPIAIDKDTKSIPVRRVTRDAGTDLHWSADGTSLHWMIGPQYFTRKLSETFSFVDGAADSLPEADSVGIDIGLRLPSDVPSGTVAFVGARVVTMQGEQVIEDGTVIVRENRIAAVGSRAQVTIPGGAHVVDATGKTLIPGIVDAHAHASHFASYPSPQRNWAYDANLAYGVTTAHDPSANTAFVFEQAELVRSGLVVGPRIFSTGTILYGADGDFKAVVNSLDDARSHLRRMKAVGAISVKSYNQPRREQRQQILQAARELGMLVVPEGGSTLFHNLTMVIDGHTGVEHNLPVAPLYADVLNVWKATQVGYTPTLVVSYGGPSGEYYWYQHTDVWSKDRLLRHVPRSVVDSRSRRRMMIPEEEYFHVTVAEQAKKLVDQGNTVQLGAHGQLQGLGAHWELWMFEQGGMTPHEALRSATLHGAQYLGLDGEIGSIETGKLADLVLIDGNPLENLRLSEQVSLVMANGRLFDPDTMNEIGNHPRTRPPHYWQREGVSDAFVWDQTDLGVIGPSCVCGRH